MTQRHAKECRQAHWLLAKKFHLFVENLKNKNRKILQKKQEQVFVDQFRNFYKPGLFGGYWGRFGRTKDISKQAIEDYAQKNPKSATAKAVQEISKRPLGLG